MAPAICRFVCWSIAVVLAVLTGYYAGTSLGFWTILAVIISIFVFWGVITTLPDLVCRNAEATSAATAESAGDAVSASAPSAKSAPAPKESKTSVAPAGRHWSDTVGQKSGLAGDGRGQSALKPSQPLPGEETLRDDVGAWRYEDAAKGAETASRKTSGAAALTADAGARPAGLSAPRGGSADDLTVIKGIGNKVEQALNALGIFHLDQIAAWSEAERAWVDTELPGFKGRVRRDNWVDQAKDLMRGDAA